MTPTAKRIYEALLKGDYISPFGKSIPEGSTEIIRERLVCAIIDRELARERKGGDDRKISTKNRHLFIGERMG